MAKPRNTQFEKNNNKMGLIDIKPLTNNQKKAFDGWKEGKNLVLHGYAGTGKSFIALAMALEETSQKNSMTKKVVLIRSAVPSRDIGFLPGSAVEKASAYEEPYEKMIATLYDRGDAYSIIKKQGMIDFRTTSYLRGLTYDDSILIIDEIQNMVDSELNTIMTRIGENTRFILCGDFRQNDLKKEKSGLDLCLRTLKKIKGVNFLEFGIDDIVRSQFVKDYIIEREKILQQE